jgi:hypothetical protein
VNGQSGDVEESTEQVHRKAELRCSLALGGFGFMMEISVVYLLVTVSRGIIISFKAQA